MQYPLQNKARAFYYNETLGPSFAGGDCHNALQINKDKLVISDYKKGYFVKDNKYTIFNNDKKFDYY